MPPGPRLQLSYKTSSQSYISKNRCPIIIYGHYMHYSDAEQKQWEVELNIVINVAMNTYSIIVAATDTALSVAAWIAKNGS